MSEFGDIIAKLKQSKANGGRTGTKYPVIIPPNDKTESKKQGAFWNDGWYVCTEDFESHYCNKYSVKSFIRLTDDIPDELLVTLKEHGVFRTKVNDEFVLVIHNSDDNLEKIAQFYEIGYVNETEQF